MAVLRDGWAVLEEGAYAVFGGSFKGSRRERGGGCGCRALRICGIGGMGGVRVTG
jgi:hypothetical protein